MPVRHGWTDHIQKLSKQIDFTQKLSPKDPTIVSIAVEDCVAENARELRIRGWRFEMEEKDGHFWFCIALDHYSFDDTGWGKENVPVIVEKLIMQAWLCALKL